MYIIHVHNTCSSHFLTRYPRFILSRPDPTAMFRLAIGSYVEQYSNVISIIKKNPSEGNLYQAAEFDHPYPCTKLMWSPDMRLGANDLLATTGDYLRIWSVTDDGSGKNMQVQKEALLNNNKTSEYCAPLTSFDWNETDPTILGTSSIDTTCTIWDVATQTALTQLIAHDREVFDLAFARGKDVFASVGADGSVRMFDLRSLEHSTIIYESPDLDPLLRLEWNKQDPNYLATFMVDSRRSVILDIRVPSLPVAELGGHLGCVNAVAWAPHSSCHICTAGDDSQALIWDLSAMPKRPVDDPILAYNADGEINNLQWSATQPDWVSIAFKDKLQICELELELELEQPKNERNLRTICSMHTNAGVSFFLLNLCVYSEGIVLLFTGRVLQYRYRYRRVV
jgi:WD repeat-containing protein 68